MKKTRKGREGMRRGERCNIVEIGELSDGIKIRREREGIREKREGMVWRENKEREGIIVGEVEEEIGKRLRRSKGG